MRLQRHILRRAQVSYLHSARLAVVCVAIAFAFRLIVVPLGSASAFATFYPAVLFSTVLAGRTAGLTSIFLSLVAAWWAFVEPLFQFNRPTPDEYLGFGLFLFCSGLIAGLALKYRQIVFQLQDSEWQRGLLADEVHHRAKNTAQLISAIVGQTVKDKDLASTLINRIHAVCAAENPLQMDGRRTTGLQQLLEETVQRAHGTKIILDGPAVELGGPQAKNLRLVFHELATNAAKYGALSNLTGTVRIDWLYDTPCLSINWCERDGPSVTAPRRLSFGSKLITNMLKDVGGRIEPTFAETGYSYKISVAPSS
jgi:two-component sensor histidine kinase